MMESVSVKLGDLGNRRFDEVVHHPLALPEGQDLEFAVKDFATASGQPAIVATFTVGVDGELRRAQAVTTLRAFLSAAKALAAAYPEQVR